MIINVFGVGRSGTKAVQLYLACLLADQYSTIHLNYEPYFWLRRSGPVSFEGLLHHYDSPQFSLRKRDFTSKHQHYLRRLTSGKEVVITKFIRGNGRIIPINELTQPNHNIIVIRSVLGVLESLFYMDWDLNTVGYRYFPYSQFSFWGQIKAYLTELNEEKINDYLEQFQSDLIGRNALYWYAMNRFALSNLPNNCTIIRYEELWKLENWATVAFALTQTPSIRQQDVFEGKNIHNQFPLSDLTPSTISLTGQKVNEFVYYLGKGRARFLRMFLQKQEIGTLVQKTTYLDQSMYIRQQTTSRVNVKIIPDVFLEFLQADIDKRIEEALTKENFIKV